VRFQNDYLVDEDLVSGKMVEKGLVEEVAEISQGQ